ncbi:hypothetical protein K8I85_00075, partial [bacterium]|nr:hypothetical protein [bacterium]
MRRTLPTTLSRSLRVVPMLIAAAVASVAVVAVVAGSAAPAAAQTWQDHAPAPMPIANNAVTTHALAGTTFVYSFLGIDSTLVPAGISHQATRLNTVSNTWELLPDVPSVKAKIAACAFTLGDSVYVVGGYAVDDNGFETTNARMDVMDPATATWGDRRANVPVRVDDMVAGTWNDTHAILVSGWSSNHNVPDVQAWEKAADTWAAATPIPDFGTFGGAGGVTGDKIVFVDGVADTGTFSFDLVNRVLVGTINPLDPTDITWEDRGPHPGLPTYRAASWNIPGDPDRIVFCGGTDNPYNFDGQGYDGHPSEPLGQVWSYHIPSGTVVFHDDKPVPTMDHRGFPWGDGRMWIVGGMEAGQMVTDRVSSWLPEMVTAVATGG